MNYIRRIRFGKLVGEKNENMGNNSIYVKMRQVKSLSLLVSSLIIE